jgi:hypothetical protein
VSLTLKKRGMSFGKLIVVTCVASLVVAFVNTICQLLCEMKNTPFEG